MIKNYLFDLDGTLLPLNEEKFVQIYFSLLAKKFQELKLDPNVMMNKLLLGTKAMIDNTGKKSNENVFWDEFYPDLDKQQQLKIDLETFYRKEFDLVKESANPSKLSAKIIQTLKQKNKRIILATNPIFPAVATEKRLQWAGLNAGDFELITTYENSKFAKPSIDYYEDIITRLQLYPEETIMIGNDALEDMVASQLGLKTFLVTDCLNNKNNIDISTYENGSLEDLFQRISNDLI